MRIICCRDFDSCSVDWNFEIGQLIRFTTRAWLNYRLKVNTQLNSLIYPIEVLDEIHFVLSPRRRFQTCAENSINTENASSSIFWFHIFFSTLPNSQTCTQTFFHEFERQWVKFIQLILFSKQMFHNLYVAAHECIVGDFQVCREIR